MAGSVVAAKHNRVRQRKLNLKQNLSVLAEDELDALEAETSQGLKEITTGVEAHEEHEHHLQAVINANAAAAGGAASQVYIPTRGTSDAEIPYEALHTHSFSQPATYIRFSSTVEECIDGAAYDMLDEDDDFLKTLNEKLRTQAQQASSRPTSRSASAAADSAPKSCSEAQFEMVMQAFETAAQNAAPFSSAVSGDQAAPILTLEEQLVQLEDTLPEESLTASPSRPNAQGVLRALASLIYPHWHARRSQNNNTPLTPAVKVKLMETGDALDDNDPYVCFRRREVRIPRKTRNRDALSAERLRRLRRELEDARILVASIRQRELFRKEQLVADRFLFEQRASLRGVKRTLTDKLQDGDEDLLINQKPRRPKPLESIQPPNRMRAGASLPKNAEEEISRRRLESANGMSVNTGPEMQSLAEWAHVREQRQVEEIKHKINQHATWNENYVDMTRAPLTPPPPDDGMVGGFRAARTEYLPTPPASIASEESRGLDESGKSGLDQSARHGLPGIGHKQRDGDIVMSGVAGPSPPAEKEGIVVNGAGVTPETSRNDSPDGLSEKVVKANERAVEQQRSLPVRVRYATPGSGDTAPTSRSPSFRRRIGRGGRMFIDRRHLHRASTPDSDSDVDETDSNMSALMRDRFKFDRDSDDDADDDPRHVHKDILDPYDWRSMLTRAQYSIGWGQHSSAAQQQAQIERNKQARIQGPPPPVQVNGMSLTASPQTTRQQVAARADQAAAVK